MPIPDFQTLMLPLLRYCADSKEARPYAAQVNNKIVLIDGPMLADLMIDYGLGVTTVTSYEIKRVDSDYFLDE